MKIERWLLSSTAAISVLALLNRSVVELDELRRCSTNGFRVLRAARTCVLNSSSWTSMLGAVSSTPRSPIPQHSSARNRRSKVNQGYCCPARWGCTPYVLRVVTPVVGSGNSHDLAKTQFQIPRSILMAGSPTAPSIHNNHCRAATSVDKLSRWKCPSAALTVVRSVISFGCSRSGQVASFSRWLYSVWANLQSSCLRWIYLVIIYNYVRRSADIREWWLWSRPLLLI